jgi:FAD synthetase
VALPDTIADIAAEVRSASARYDHVFTSGGVGPTHDDLTLPGVAAALGVPVVRHPELEGILRARMGEACNEAALRMAEIPEGAELWWEGQVRWPLVVARNVAIFPGVPALLRAKFDAVAHRFAGVPVQTRRVVTTATEPEIADLLTEAARRWESVAIGSYPRFETTPRTVIVTMESRENEALVACEAWLRERMPSQIGG